MADHNKDKKVSAKVSWYENKDLDNICTPINVDQFEKLLHKTNYPHDKTTFLVDGFTHGFSLEYTGPMNRKDRSRNIPFTVGDKYDLWEKVMKEVKLGRFAGPFKEIPFENYVQSPVGLVPKAGNQTRMIFHLSYRFKNGNESINFWTPKEKCTVHYNDIDHAIQNCLRLMEKLAKMPGVVHQLFYGKTDLKSAFRVVPMLKKYYCLLVIMVRNPINNQELFFVNKCMPFGASISCSHFQKLSNALLHIVQVLEKAYNSITNYLDDFLFIHYLRQVCNKLMRTFLWVCEQINFPVALKKTEWANTSIVFLGMLFNGKTFSLMIPVDKVNGALHLIQRICDKKKATVKELQVLTGTLNFMTRAIAPGRVFTR